MLNTRLVILDRDGVINEDRDDYVKSVDEWIAIPGSIEAIAKLTKTGYTVVVATNQSGLSRGLFDLDELEAMNDKLCRSVESLGGEIAGVFYCPHHPDDNCECRKPRTGLLDAIEDTLGLSVTGAPFIGDSLRDLQAAESKKCLPVLVKTGKGERTLGQPMKINSQIKIFDNLADAADAIINNKL